MSASLYEFICGQNLYLCADFAARASDQERERERHTERGLLLKAKSRYYPEWFRKHNFLVQKQKTKKMRRCSKPLTFCVCGTECNDFVLKHACVSQVYQIYSKYCAISVAHRPGIRRRKLSWFVDRQGFVFPISPCVCALRSGRRLCRVNIWWGFIQFVFILAVLGTVSNWSIQQLTEPAADLILFRVFGYILIIIILWREEPLTSVVPASRPRPVLVLILGVFFLPPLPLPPSFFIIRCNYIGWNGSLTLLFFFLFICFLFPFWDRLHPACDEHSRMHIGCTLHVTNILECIFAFFYIFFYDTRTRVRTHARTNAPTHIRARERETDR